MYNMRTLISLLTSTFSSIIHSYYNIPHGSFFIFILYNCIIQRNGIMFKHVPERKFDVCLIKLLGLKKKKTCFKFQVEDIIKQRR